MKRRFKAKAGLINEVFAQFQSTFLALCELINNSLQADAKKIEISINYLPDNELTSLVIDKLVIKDDGCGVHISEIEKKLFGFGDSTKKGGKGIGRSAALQIGAKCIIETIGFDDKTKTYSKAIIPLTNEIFRKDKDINEIEVETTEENLTGNHNTYYQVTIENFYDSLITANEPRRKVSEKLLAKNINNSIFERYPLPIFNRKIKFYINDVYLDPLLFVNGEPEKIKVNYLDKKGIEHPIFFTYFNLKPTFDHIKIFLTTKNAGIEIITSGFEYQADWLSPKIGSWFVYIFSENMQTDVYRNLDMDTLDENVAHFKTFLKDKLNHFFKQKNEEFDNFTQKLKSDKYYPYKTSPASSNSKNLLFDKLAYLVEEKYNLITGNNQLREIIYPMIDKTITIGELDTILRNILRLEKKYLLKFNDLLEKAELENIIEFSERVAKKLQDVEFMEKITYGEISKHILERKELHKILEKMLWIFGDRYNENTKVLSDKSLENNLRELRDKYLEYKPDKNSDNINEFDDKKIKSITDLFLFNQKIIDEEKREILVIELKAPKVKISPKEIGQVMQYAREIERRPFFSENLKFQIILISSDINDDAKFDMKGRQNNGNTNPYFYFKNQKENIEIWIMKWSDLIENNKRKLTYLSNALKTKDINVLDKIQQDFSEIEFTKIKSVLKKVNV